MERPTTIRRAAIGIALIVLFSKGIGFIREMVIAFHFGTGSAYDIYLIGISVPIAAYTLFGATVTNLFVPEYARAKLASNREEAMKAVWGRFLIIVAAATAGVAIIIIAAPMIIRAIAPGLEAERYDSAAFVTRMGACIILFGLFEGFFRAVLNAEKRFLIPASSSLVFNAVIIASIVVFAGALSTEAILYGLVAGFFLQMAVVFIPFMRLTFPLALRGGFTGLGAGKFMAAVAGMLLIETVAQLYSIVDRFFASGMDAGVVSALGYMYLLITLPVLIFASALSTAIFPYLSDSHAAADAPRRNRLIMQGTCVSLLMAAPAVITLWIFGEEVISILFQRGAFDEHSVALTHNLLTYYAFSLPGQFVIYLFSRVHYATGRNGLLLILVSTALALKVLVAGVTVGTIGMAGLGWSAIISYNAGGVLMIAVAGRSVGQLNYRLFFGYALKVMVASAAMSTVAWALHYYLFQGEPPTPTVVIHLALSLTVSTGIYGVICYILKLQRLPGDATARP